MSLLEVVMRFTANGGVLGRSAASCCILKNLQVFQHHSTGLLGWQRINSKFGRHNTKTARLNGHYCTNLLPLPLVYVAKLPTPIFGSQA